MRQGFGNDKTLSEHTLTTSRAMHMGCISYKEDVPTITKRFVRCARHRLPHSISRSCPNLYNLGPFPLLPNIPPLVERFLNRSQIWLCGREFMRNRKIKRNAPKGQVFGI